MEIEFKYLESWLKEKVDEINELESQMKLIQDITERANFQDKEIRPIRVVISYAIEAYFKSKETK